MPHNGLRWAFPCPADEVGSEALKPFEGLCNVWALQLCWENLPACVHLFRRPAAGPLRVTHAASTFQMRFHAELSRCKARSSVLGGRLIAINHGYTYSNGRGKFTLQGTVHNGKHEFFRTFFYWVWKSVWLHQTDKNMLCFVLLLLRKNVSKVLLLALVMC